jgi:hypothetical protein
MQDCVRAATVVVIVGSESATSMLTLARSTYLDSSFGVATDLPRAGTALENPFVFDAAARELKQLADRGLIEIVAERTVRHADEQLIERLSFKRLR